MHSNRLNRWVGIGVVVGALLACAEDETGAPVIENPETCFVDAPASSSNCLEPELESYYCTAFAGNSVEQPQTIGTQQPFWVLQDLQPQSCGYAQHYGLNAFHGTPTVVVLLWSGCGFCQAQTEKLQLMHFELQASNIDVNFVLVDQARPNPPTQELTDRCNFPIFQDESWVNAWALMGGQKDDFYFYDSNGVLQNFIPHTGNIVLSTEEGYAHVKNAVLDLVDSDGQVEASEQAEADESSEP